MPTGSGIGKIDVFCDTPYWFDTEYITTKDTNWCALKTATTGYIFNMCCANVEPMPSPVAVYPRWSAQNTMLWFKKGSTPTIFFKDIPIRNVQLKNNFVDESSVFYTLIGADGKGRKVYGDLSIVLWPLTPEQMINETLNLEILAYKAIRDEEQRINPNMVPVPCEVVSEDALEPAPVSTGLFMTTLESTDGGDEVTSIRTSVMQDVQDFGFIRKLPSDGEATPLCREDSEESQANEPMTESMMRAELFGEKSELTATITPMRPGDPALSFAAPTQAECTEMVSRRLSAMGDTVEKQVLVLKNDRPIQANRSKTCQIL